ncbi:MAG TPA: ATP-dependent DNA helicase RecG [Syntrophomonadaceae bacterium]|nr:ATP-dependent DNA helicase RecG [Syntrophomonadaceae bacterium]HNX27799.1 ATP-dependent DNA helicase RecG [Syntrophomonadaceae bacterium]HPR93591.1 ATP-dependent DNA helicase RecG [Syntrophomonadaceae bacterium]
MERLKASIQYVKGVGPARVKQLSRLGITTVFDIMWHIPRGYIDRNAVTPISALQAGGIVSIKAKVLGTSINRTRRGMSIFKALLQDNSGITTAVWFNQPFLKSSLKSGMNIYLNGKVANMAGKLEISASEYDILDEEDTGDKTAAIYALTEGLNQKSVRKIVTTVLQDHLSDYPEILTAENRQELGLCDIRFALQNIHFPADRYSYALARRRLAFEELILFQLSLCQQAALIKMPGSVSHKEQDDLIVKVSGNLPYKLTRAQERVVKEIFADMESNTNMGRLLQGDVGAGKTVVAALAAAKCVSSGFQAAIMAPTEILARQHFKSLQKFFAGTNVAIACLTSGTNIAARRQILDALARGEIKILVGTHAIIQDDIVFSALGLTVIDEQHRFGVRQRARLNSKGGYPDMLVMTATPIPRTLALTLYGDLEMSVIDELPPGRKQVLTRYFPTPARKSVYEFIRKQVKTGAQAYFVCPLVEESQKQDLMAAVSLYNDLSQTVFAEYKVGLIHGRMKSMEKEKIIYAFNNGEIDILVSTTVIEVGIDVPAATLMIIEHAERFGIAQLHQLRGRVGRSERQSYCILMGNPQTEEALRRIKAMEATNDGFILSQEDLKIRGPGEFMGVRQHGLQQFKIADLTADTELSEKARQAARNIQWQNKELLAEYLRLKFKNEPEAISG